MAYLTMSYRLWGKLTQSEFVILNDLWSLLYRRGLLGVPDHKRATENNRFFALGTQGRAMWNAPTLPAGMADILDIANRLSNGTEKPRKRWNYLGNAQVKLAYQAYLNQKYWDNQAHPDINAIAPDQLERLVTNNLVSQLDLVPPFNFFDAASQKLLETLTVQLSGIELDPFLLPNFQQSIVIRIEQGQHVCIDLSVAKGEQNTFALECSYVCHDR